MKKSFLISFALIGSLSFVSQFTEAQIVAGGYYEKTEACSSPEGVYVMRCRPALDSSCNVSGQVPCSLWEEIIH